MTIAIPTRMNPTGRNLNRPMIALGVAAVAILLTVTTFVTNDNTSSPTTSQAVTSADTGTTYQASAGLDCAPSGTVAGCQALAATGAPTGDVATGAVDTRGVAEWAQANGLTGLSPASVAPANARTTAPAAVSSADRAMVAAARNYNTSQAVTSYQAQAPVVGATGTSHFLEINDAGAAATPQADQSYDGHRGGPQ